MAVPLLLRTPAAAPARPAGLDDALASIEAGASGAAVTREAAEALLDARGADLDRLLAVAGRIRDNGLLDAGRPGVITYSRKVFLPLTHLCRDRCHYCVFVQSPGKLAAAGISPFLEPDEVLRIAREGAALGCKEALLTLGDRPEDRWPIAREWLAERGYASTLEYVGDMARRILAETGLLPHLNPGVMSYDELAALKPVGPSMGMMLETTSRRLYEDRGEAHFGSPDKDPAVRLQVLEDAGRLAIPFTSGLLLGIGESVPERVDTIMALREIAERHGNLQEVIVQNFRAKPATAMLAAPDLETEEYAAAIAVTRVLLGPGLRVQAPPNLTDPGELALLLRAGIDDWGGVSPLTPDHVNPERPWPQLDELARLTAESGFLLRERLTAHPHYVREARDAGADWFAGDLGSRLTALAGADGLAAVDVVDVTRVADAVRAERVGEVVTYVVNENWDWGTPPAEWLAGRADGDRGTTEVCIQGFSPLGAEASLAAVRALKVARPNLHVHAFNPEDIARGADETGTSVPEFLRRMIDAGVDTIPGTRPRAAGWREIVTAAHRAGLRSTATMVFGAGETRADRAAHLGVLRTIQAETGGFTEFIPLPAPSAAGDLALAREVTAMARIMLAGAIDHIQATWPRLGIEAALPLLEAGADDLGGTIGRVSPAEFAAIAAAAGRPVRQRTTRYA